MLERELRHWRVEIDRDGVWAAGAADEVNLLGKLQAMVGVKGQERVRRMNYTILHIYTAGRKSSSDNTQLLEYALVRCTEIYQFHVLSEIYSRFSGQDSPLSWAMGLPIFSELRYQVCM